MLGVIVLERERRADFAARRSLGQRELPAKVGYATVYNPCLRTITW